MALCVYLLLWLLSTIHVSLAADDGGAQDPAPDSDPAPVVTVGKAVTVKDELTVREGKDSKRLDPLQHLQDYETAGKLVDEHPQAVRIADKEITNPLGNFHVHLWAHLGSLPPAFCIPLEKEIPELPPKPLLKALEEVLSSLVNETAADPQIQEKVIEIIKPFEKFRNCCDKYFVFIDVKVPEFKPSEKSLYIWSKIAGHGNEKAGEGGGGSEVAQEPAVEPTIDAPQETQEAAVKGPEAGAGDEPEKQPQGGASDGATQEPTEQGAGNGEEEQRPTGSPEAAGAETEHTPDQPEGGARPEAPPGNNPSPPEEQGPEQRRVADPDPQFTLAHLASILRTQCEFQDFPRQNTSVTEAEFAEEAARVCPKDADVNPKMLRQIFERLDADKNEKVSFKEWLNGQQKLKELADQLGKKGPD